MGVRGFIYFILEQDIHRAFRPHHRDFRRRPGIVNIATHMLAIHHIISPTIGLTSDHRDLGHGSLAVGIEQFGAMADNAIVFLAHAR